MGFGANPVSLMVVHGGDSPGQVVGIGSHELFEGFDVFGKVGINSFA
jgi:hypothetical protein